MSVIMSLKRYRKSLFYCAHLIRNEEIINCKSTYKETIYITTYPSQLII